MSTAHPDLFAALAAPFEPEEVKARTQSGKQLHYVTARANPHRLSGGDAMTNQDIIRRLDQIADSAQRTRAFCRKVLIEVQDLRDALDPPPADKLVDDFELQPGLQPEINNQRHDAIDYPDLDTIEAEGDDTDEPPVGGCGSQAS